ncbi:MAG: indole-3-glycerol phosphate synthase TrpC [Pyrinomonadaceae bacterium]
MTETFLHKIFEAKKKRVVEQKHLANAGELRELALQVRYGSLPHRLRKALQNPRKINIIAEIKRASPSKGVINDNINVEAVAKSYERGGACAISVLTEEDFFKGSMDDLRTARQAVDLPILRKDFVFDEFQIYEAAEAGADAILLIAAMLDDEELQRLHRLTEIDLSMDALVEVHTLQEMERIMNIGGAIIGVNNRDLHSFAVSLDVSRSLIKHTPKNTLIISESGLRTRDDIRNLKQLGFSGFLIGETLMKSADAENALMELTGN